MTVPSHPFTSFMVNIVGVWLSLVEHTVRDRGVAGSNPVTPTFNSLPFITGPHAASITL